MVTIAWLPFYICKNIWTNRLGLWQQVFFSGTIQKYWHKLTNLIGSVDITLQDNMLFRNDN